MTYGDTALIRRMNVGLRRRKDKDVRGYVLDTVEGRWCKEADLAKNVHGEAPRYPAGDPPRRGPPQRAAAAPGPVDRHGAADGR